MKILALHSDYIKFESRKKAIKDAEAVKKAKETVKECLVVFSSVEKRDETNPENVARRYVQEVKDIAKQVKAKKIVIYPYVHLSNDPGNPKTALNILKEAEDILKKEYDVTRAPFGWYKSFEIKCKGHPLSELSREFSSTEGEKKGEILEAVKAEEKLKSYWYIMNVNGDLNEIKILNDDVAGFNFSKYPNLLKFAKYEMAKVRAVKEEPAHVKLMKKLELVDYEPGSDSGNLRYYPKGRLIKKLLETYVTDKTIEYGGVEVETPVMYNIEHPSIARYLAKFPARQYIIESDKNRYFLRFSACFGQFLMAHNTQISYKNLPFRLYELTRYSFRREKSGELTGLRRLRAFTMPDVHALCGNLKQAIEEFKIRFELCKNVISGIGISLDDIELAVRTTKDFYEEHKELIKYLVKTYNKPALIEMWDSRQFYFILKYELNFIDSMDKASALSTDQIDVENGERYELNFVDNDGKKKIIPYILHCSPSGAIERDIYALLEKADMDNKKGKTAILPLWLSPTQIRIIPVSNDKHLDFAVKLAEELIKKEIRTDVDDNDETINKRIRRAEEEWISYILVVGDKEINEKQLMVRIRETGKQEKYTKEDLVKEIKNKTKDKPWKPLPLPLLLSKRPIFVG